MVVVAVMLALAQVVQMRQGDPCRPRGQRPAQSGHLLDIALRPAPCRVAVMGVLLLDLQSLHTAVDLLTAFALRPDFLAGLEEPANRALLCCST